MSHFKQFAESKIHTLFPNPQLSYLPVFQQYSSTIEVDQLHESLCKKLAIEDILTNFSWSFSNRFRNTFGEAEYFKEKGTMRWRIRYASRFWILIGAEARKNLITHEVCHLAVEKLYGHGKQSHGFVYDHGQEWQDLMIKCGEDPNMLYAPDLQQSPLLASVSK